MGKLSKSVDSNKLSIAITIHVNKLIEFVDSSGNYDWGSFESPFDANQFFTLQSSDGRNVPKLYPGRKVEIEIIPEKAEESMGFEVQSVKFCLVGDNDPMHITPKQDWSRVISLGKTDGAISDTGDFHLGHLSSDELTFSMYTADSLRSNSKNLCYSIVFAITDGNEKLRYCKIDPLMRTSPED